MQISNKYLKKTFGYIFLRKLHFKIFVMDIQTDSEFLNSQKRGANGTPKFVWGRDGRIKSF